MKAGRVRTLRNPVRLEVMSSIPSECRSGTAEFVKSYEDGTVLLHMLGTKRYYGAWPRPGGDETDFVCGALAPGDPIAALRPRTGLKDPVEPNQKAKKEFR